MNFHTKLIEARFLRRYKRFFADVALADGTEITAHCPNPGAMLGLQTPGARAFLSKSDSKTRKLSHTLELLETDDGLVGINTGLPNRLAGEAIAAGRIPELAGYAERLAEQRYHENSRIDWLLRGPERADAYIEVKNVHLRRLDRSGGTAAEFPDCVTARGAKHLDALVDMAALGYRAVMLYIVQRTDCDHFRIAADIDPAYDAAFRRAASAGVEMLCYDCSVERDGVAIRRRLPAVIDGPSD
jgi:sugar fermentation stimulation protein A